MHRLGIIMSVTTMAAAALFITIAIQCGAKTYAWHISPDVAAILAPDTIANPYAAATKEAPDSGCVRLRTYSPANVGRAFNDSNHTHLSAAALSGIQPITDDQSAWDNGRGLRRVRSCADFYIDTLSHSYPYLTSTAANLLHEIGRRFNDSLQARGGGQYRIKVTSLLRSDRTVGRLRRVNRNATSQSAHQYGATFDISHSKFICDNPDGVRRSFEELKNLLAEIVHILRNEGRLYVKYERRQACLHITARPTATQHDSSPPKP